MHHHPLIKPTRVVRRPIFFFLRGVTYMQLHINLLHTDELKLNSILRPVNFLLIFDEWFSGKRSHPPENEEEKRNSPLLKMRKKDGPDPYTPAKVETRTCSLPSSSSPDSCISQSMRISIITQFKLSAVFNCLFVFLLIRLHTFKSLRSNGS